MKLNRKGVTRIVLEFKNIVVKIPNFSYQWDHFLLGLIANIRESRTYKYNKNSELLCPVLWCSWGGWVLIMKKADVEKHIKEVNADSTLEDDPNLELRLRYSKWIDAGFGGDDKCDNYGYIGEKLVKIDYN